MELNLLTVLLGIILAAAGGFAVAWLARGKPLARSTNYASSLEQLLAGTLRDRDTALERERAKVSAAQTLQQEQAQRLLELEKELEHRELQVVAFREEAIQLARTREELAQRLSRRDHTIQELEGALAARTRDLEALGGFQEGIRPSGARATGAERELAAQIAAHEDDLAQLEARFLDQVRSREAELESVRQRLQSAEAASLELRERDAQLAIARERIAELEPVAERAAEAAARTEQLERELRDREAARAKLRKRLAELELRLRETATQSAGEATEGPERGGERSGRDSKEEPSPMETLPEGNGLAPAVAGDPVEGVAGVAQPRPRRFRRKATDDLTLIHGIDPAMEHALHELGVTSFRQIAKWKDRDIERMARKLEETPERIRRDGWVESARREHVGKYGRGP